MSDVHIKVIIIKHMHLRHDLPRQISGCEIAAMIVWSVSKHLYGASDNVMLIFA